MMGSLHVPTRLGGKSWQDPDDILLPLFSQISAHHACRSTQSDLQDLRIENMDFSAHDQYAPLIRAHSQKNGDIPDVMYPVYHDALERELPRD